MLAMRSRKITVAIILLAALALDGCATLIKSPLAQCKIPNGVATRNDAAGTVTIFTNERTCRDLSAKITENLATGLQPHELYGVKCEFALTEAPEITPGPTSVITASKWCETNDGKIEAYLSYPLQVFMKR